MPKVEEVMTRGVLTVDSNTTVVEAAELMAQKGVGDVVVTENNRPRGIVTERDFVRRVIAKKRPLDTKIADVMTTPLITIEPDASLNEAARKMVNNKIRRLPVIKEHKLVGIIVVSDFAKHLSKKTLTETVLEAIWRYP
ncbi:MAG: CBS domain-containing protein [Candidatus Bathyarchaeota archaeon]|nr:CBS domain-containing protein [Candidatus Bathyarchaeota archaeon]